MDIFKDSEELFLLLYQDLEIPESNISGYFNALTTNIILKNLSAADRQYLYALVESKNWSRAKQFVKEKIPDMDDLFIRAVGHLIRKN